MRDSTADRDPIEMLADSFLARFRRGERPSVEDYAAQHPELAQEIRELLPALVMLEQEKPSASGAAGTDGGRAGAAPGSAPRQLGDYLILREIGRGGMGVVYESVQQSLGRHVALKVLPLQALAGSSHLARFRMEARAAARLHHTNIVPVFGVGDCDGVHYYAMQFIQGQGLDVVIDALRELRNGSAPVSDARGETPGSASGALRPPTAVLTEALLTGRFAAPQVEPGTATTTAEPHTADASATARNGAADGACESPRPESGVSSALASGQAGASYYQSVAGIGVQVAEALAYAHGQGILHRDIKPSNLLLDAKGTVWVTDFGLAKAEGGDRLTRTGDVVGTLRYMAPERLDGWSDPRSDVYALGATLYELLTLRPPFRESDRVKLVDQVLNQDPAHPRKLDGRIPRDLETIVQKALAKSPGSRYASAGQMAEDLPRFAAHRPILARRPSLLDRAGKWVRRRPGIAASGTAILVLAVVALAVSNALIAREKQNAVHQKERGDRHLARVRTVLDKYMANTAEDRRLKAAGLHDLRRALLLSMVAILEEFVGPDRDDRVTQLDRGWALEKLGDIWREVGETDKALTFYDQARASWDRLAVDFPGAPAGRNGRADCDNKRGTVLTALLRLDDAEKAIRQALKTREQLAREYPAVAEYQSGIGGALHELSLVERRRPNKDAERQLLEQAITHQEAAVRIDPTHYEARKFLANHHGNLGVVLMEMKRPAEAAAAIDKSRVLFAELSADYPDDADLRSAIAGCWINLGNLRDHERPDEALKAYRQAVAVKETLAAEYPSVPEYRRDLAGVYQNIGLLLGAPGQEADAQAAFDACLALREQLVKEHPAQIDYTNELAASLIRRGCHDADAGRFEAALKPLGRAVSLLETLSAPLRGAARTRGMLLRANGAEADALLRLGRHAEAVHHFDQALTLDGGEKRSYFRVERAIALAHLKKHGKAAAEAEAVIDEGNLPAFLIQDAAAVFAVCSAAVPDDAELSEHYAARAVNLLRRAFEKNESAIATDVRRDKNLDVLRSREDFKKLLAEWEANSTK
jgi:serine/threonine protein kinase